VTESGIANGQTETRTSELASILESRGALSVDEFTSWSGIGRSKFYKEVAEGRLRLRKVGRKSVVTVPDALAWLENLPDGGCAHAAKS
jgi:hypothetical protein